MERDLTDSSLDELDSEDFEEESADNNVQSESNKCQIASRPTPLPCNPSTDSRKNAWIDDCNTEYAKLKLIRIPKGEVIISKKRWGIEEILATLVQHRKDPRLQASYRQFKHSAGR